MIRITHAGLSDPGRVRSQNEDRWFADGPLGLYGVTDGMGGRAAGALAARVVAETLPLLVRQHLAEPAGTAREAGERLLRALVALSENLRDGARSQRGLEGMGATVVVGLVRDWQMVVAHMGDSRAYLLRGACLERLTRDHSLAQFLVDSGELLPAELADHPARNHLTQYVGMEEAAVPQASLLELCSGDRLLFCSDGLSGMIGDGDLAAILARHADPEEACRQLVRAANEAGGSDNITALVLTVAGWRHSTA